MFKLRIKKQKGFTLIEIMIVLVVLGLLVAVALPKVSQVLFTGKTNSTKASLSSLSKAIKNFNADTSVWPGNITDLMSTIVAGRDCYNSKALTASTYSAAQVKNWKGPYMDGTTNEISVDSWGAKISIGVVDASNKYTGKDSTGAAVTVDNAVDSDSFRELGSVQGLYLHSPGDDTMTGTTASGTAKDDIFVFISGKLQ